MYSSSRTFLRPRFADRLVMVRRAKSVRPTRAVRESAVTAATAVAPAAAIRKQQQQQQVALGRRIWQAYTKSLHERPLVTKATFAATIFFVSDSATQYIVCDDKELFRWNAPRALSGAGFGIIATGWLHYWWGFLEATVARRLPVATHRMANAATKVVLDQAIGAPLYIYTYYVLTNFFQEQLSSASTTTSQRSMAESWKETCAKAQEMLWPTMLKHWRVWIPVHSCNFYFVPLHHRVMVQNTVLTFWSGYLSHLNHQTKIMSPDEEIKDTIQESSSLSSKSLSLSRKQQQQEETTSVSRKQQPPVDNKVAAVLAASTKKTAAE